MITVKTYLIKHVVDRLNNVWDWLKIFKLV